MTKNFQVGDYVWVAKFSSTKVKVPCPICFGNKVVTLILGNDDTVILPCEICREGMNDSTGYVTEYQRTPHCEKVKITKKRTEEESNKTVIQYFSDCFIYYEKDIFETEQEAMEEAKRRQEIWKKEEDKRLKVKPDKNYSWNAGYHLRAAKQAELDLEYHRSKAILCKAKARTQET